MQKLFENCKTSIRRFDSDRRLCEPQELRTSTSEALSFLGRLLGSYVETELVTISFER
jgi:hypothetical protein